MSQADVIDIIRSFLIIMNDAGLKIEKAYLFGSYANNQASEESDIDVLLISESFDTDDDIILSSPWLFASKIDHRIEPIAVGKKKFRIDQGSPLLETVRQTGIEIKL